MGTRNLAFAHVRYPETILRWGIMDLAKHQVRVAHGNLLQLLYEEHAWMRECGADVVVESQPASGACKILSHCLNTYFDVVDREDGRRRNFHFMSAHNKLKYDVDVYDAVRPVDSRGRKEVSMLVTERVMQEQSSDEFARFYSTYAYKQRTDLADALIQALRYLQTKCPKSKRVVQRTGHKASRFKSDFEPRYDRECEPGDDYADDEVMFDDDFILQ